MPVQEPDQPPFDEGASAALGEPQPGKPGKPGKEPRRPAKTPRIALQWVDEAAVAETALAPRDLSAAATSYVAVGADLLARAPRRSPFRAGVLVPIAIIAALIGGYSGTTLLWPLHAVAPEIEAVQVDSAPAPATTIAWPAEGSGAVAVTGFDGTLASTQDAAPIASITKVVTALLVLEELPLAVGEQGEEYQIHVGRSLPLLGVPLARGVGPRRPGRRHPHGVPAARGHADRVRQQLRRQAREPPVAE